MIQAIRTIQAAEPLGARILSYGPRPEGWVSVALRHGQTALAGELRQRFGEAIHVSFQDVDIAFDSQSGLFPSMAHHW